jgi:hypothetical protein
MKRAGALLASIMAVLAGCGPGGGDATPVDMVTPEQREETRRSIYRSMIAEEGCYMHNLDYAINDKDFLERVLTKMLVGKTLDSVILSDRAYTSSGLTYEVARMMREGPAAYAAETRTPDGVSRLTGVVDERFAHPQIEMQRGIVIVDYGHVAAKLSLQGDRIGIDFSSSPHVDENREWQSREIAVAMKYQLAMHPGADGVRLLVSIPGNPKGADWVYEYLRASDRVTVSVGTAKFVSEPIGRDFRDYVSAEKSLSTASMKTA